MVALIRALFFSIGSLNSKDPCNSAYVIKGPLVVGYPGCGF